MSVTRAVISVALAQCPCSGGEGGTNPFLVLAVVAATWWLASTLTRVWEKKNKGAIAVGKPGKLTIVAAVAVAVVLVIALKGGEKSGAATENETGAQQVAPQVGGEAGAAIPRLVDLGSGMCIPCKMMAPILEELKRDYKGRFDTVYVDVQQERDTAREYRVRVIPTQIFFDASGKELFRHEGFISKEDILAKWKELGFDMEKETADEPTP